MKDPIKFVHLNGLEYNPNRDPQFYRRLPGQPFSIQVALRGEGTVTARFEVDGTVVAEKSFALPGKVECDVRLDVMDLAWVG